MSTATRPLTVIPEADFETGTRVLGTSPDLALAEGQSVIIRLTIECSFPLRTDHSHDNQQMFTIESLEGGIDSAPLKTSYVYGDMQTSSASPTIGKLNLVSVGAPGAQRATIRLAFVDIAQRSPGGTGFDHQGIYTDPPTGDTGQVQTAPGSPRITGTITVGAAVRAVAGRRRGHFS